MPEAWERAACDGAALRLSDSAGHGLSNGRRKATRKQQLMTGGGPQSVSRSDYPLTTDRQPTAHTHILTHLTRSSCLLYSTSHAGSAVGVELWKVGAEARSEEAGGCVCPALGEEGGLLPPCTAQRGEGGGEAEDWVDVSG